MDFEKDLGLELLMNNKKKVSSDSISISSHVAKSDVSEMPSVEPVDVRQHLQPPQSPKQSSDEDYSYEDDDEDTYEASESADSIPNFPQQKYAPPPQQNFYQPQAPRMSDEDIINEKKELLYQFERLERKGMMLPRKFTLASNLEEMRMELERLKRDRELDNSVKFQRRMLMTAVSGIEFAAEKFPALGANLNGWSSNVNDELDEYDDIFVELHDKYKGKAKIAPELRLLGGLAGSAFMYHMTSRFSNSLPGLDQVLKNNPELASKLAEATRTQMNQQQQQQNNFFSGLGGLGGMFGNLFGGGAPQHQPPPIPREMAPQPNTPPQGVKMKGPANVDDILNELNSLNDNRVEMMSTISGSELADDDVSSINGLFLNKKGKSIDLDI
jgi:hypothetical protein